MSIPRFLRARVAAKAQEALDIQSFVLVGADGIALPAFSPGSHIDVTAPGGAVRQYSLCGDPSQEGHYRIAVLRDALGRGGSVAMHDDVQVGDILQISAPKNHFPLVADARRSMLLAGGIGVTPLLSMAEQLSCTGADFAFHYFARSSPRAAFLDRMRKASYAHRVRFHFDDVQHGQPLDAAVLLREPAEGTHLYVCGPRGFMDHVLRSARGNGWPESRLHYEFFAAAAPAASPASGFEVRLASTGRVIAVPGHRSVAQALADAGIIIPVSCEQGVCGTCLTRVLDGTPDHRDSVLTPQEQAANDQFTPCCSRSLSPVLVLDL